MVYRSSWLIFHHVLL
uniref:Uncharacterized protein n=1 Tax=Lepeophtheirus salmonis TaxID=72036 RepID=A0A0K2U2N4_LEPSM